MTRKRLWVLGLAVGVSGGCAGLGETSEERAHRWDMVFKQDMRMLVDDFDMFAQTNLPNRLTKFPQR